MFIFGQHPIENKSPLTKYFRENNGQLYAVVEEVELQKPYEIEFVVKTDSLHLDNKLFILNDKLICKFRGDSSQRAMLYKKIKPGNKIFMSGTFQKGKEKRNPGEFDYNKYLLQQGITGIFVAYNTDSISIIGNKSELFKSLILSVRKRLDKIIHDLHNPETAGLLRGLLLADRSEIDYDTRNVFVNSGVIHVLAVSGLHVGYILLIFVFLFGRFGIYTRSVLTIIGLMLFMFITGIPPSVFRATLMAIIIILAFLYNRSTNINNSVAIAAVIILLFNPEQLFNPGFQLSFSAVLAIGWLYPYFQTGIKRMKIRYKFIEFVLLFIAVSLSAQIGTLPFTLFYFSKLSLISLFANLIVIPMIGIIIGTAFITIALGVITYPLAIYFASVNDLLVFLIFRFIKFTGELNFSFLWIRNYSTLDAVIFYIILIALVLSLKRIRKFKVKLGLVLISFLAIILFSKIDDKILFAPDKLNVLMIDVGQGDSFLVQFPDKKTGLIDAGNASPYFDNGEKTIIPLLDYLGINKIDYGFITHFDMDHYGGFVSLINANRIKKMFLPWPDSSEKSIRFENFLKNMKVEKEYYHPEEILIDKVKIHIFNNPMDNYFKKFSSNDKSGFFKIEFGSTSFLFVGDAEIPAEKYYLEHYKKELDSDVLKIGHHGSITGSTIEFLKAVSPRISLVSVGRKNKFGHPSDIVLKRLKFLNSDIYRTDSLGAVLLQSDGKNIKYIDWRKYF